MSNHHQKSIYSDESERVAAILSKLVSESGLSYRSLGEKIGLNKDAVQALLQGQRKLGFVEWLRICKVLEIGPQEFLSNLEN